MRKKKRRMNTADWFLILLSLLSLAGLVFRFFGMRKRYSDDLVSFAVTVRWNDVNARTVSCLKNGEILYTPAGEVYGTVVSVETVPAKEEILSGGAVYRADSVTRVNVILKIEVMGRAAEERFFTERGELLSAGQRVRLYSRRAELHLEILAVSPVPPI